MKCVFAAVATLGCLLSVHGAITLQLAQSHVFSAPNRTFTEYNLKAPFDVPDFGLHLVGARLALAIVEFGDIANPTNPRLSITNDETTSPVEIVLRGPEHLPKTQGDANATDPMGEEQGRGAARFFVSVPRKCLFHVFILIKPHAPVHVLGRPLHVRAHSVEIKKEKKKG